MKTMAWRVFLGVVVGLALVTLGMFAFVVAVRPGECTDASCLAVQTYSPAATVELPPTVEPSNSGAPAPPVAPQGSAAPTGSPPAATAAPTDAGTTASPTAAP